MRELPKAYNPQDYEEKIYRMWEEGGYFAPEASGGQKSNVKGQKSFCIIMPPPNANGDLHIGHALFVALEDIMTRYRRLKGDAALWLPGADHAGFETQVVYERKLEKEGKTRLQMSREEFYKAVWDFTRENKKNMESQMRRLGASCDWTREKFTLDPDIIEVVYHTFKTLYDDGLVYRGERLVNYCTHHQTTFSDLEVKYEERKDPLYYIRYPLINKNRTGNRQLTTDNWIVVATVRPETMLGDTAVAVHPEDARYRHLIGTSVALPLTDRVIPIIAERTVDPEFGTGAVKVTPAHDMADWEIGKRHGLEVRHVIGKDGRMNEHAGAYAGLSVMEARQRVAEDLKKQGLLERVEEDYLHRVGVCYKCGTVIEPAAMPQWFVKTKPLAEKAIAAVKEGKIKIIPEYFEKTYFHWLENIKDWNISRQLWWGIPIPAWFCREMKNEKCKTKNGVIIDIEKAPRECPHCGSKEIFRDPDTFDTWFSSGQWPFATLLTSGKRKTKNEKRKKRNGKLPWTTEDFEYFYPTAVMETGYEILFFWVARMVMLGLYMTGAVPFRAVYLHGTVRDKYKRKISKSLGNVVNPMEIIALYGADALRMGLVAGNTPGTDLALDEQKIAGYRNFANKLWNIARFVAMNLDEGFSPKEPAEIQSLTEADRMILDAEKAALREASEALAEYRIYLAAETLYHYVWHTLADQYLEASKAGLKDDATKENTRQLLYRLLSHALTALHPFMPFVTEAIWQHLPPAEKDPLIIQRWPRHS